MSAVMRKDLQVTRRTVMQNAKLAIRDVFDVIVELVTNADDRYQVLGKNGRVEIEIKRHRGRPSVLRVRDFADGMTSEEMELKLARMGDRVSGMEKGHFVRGTNSRGAKDIAALGNVTFESIGSDKKLHTCRITKYFSFELDKPCPATKDKRTRLGIPFGTGTVVTISLEPSHAIPNHRDLLKKVACLVPLRDIITQNRTKLLVSDLQQQREDKIVLPPISGNCRVVEKFEIPGYSGMLARLKIYRAKRQFEHVNPRFRLGGILIKSQHAIHEATLFDSTLESDPCAAWFYGRLECEAIDILWNDFDNRFSEQLPALESNPFPIVDPSRRSGLTRAHPAVNALYKEALKRLRPLVEEERQREQREQSHVESRETRKRLDALENAANQFIEQNSEEEDVSRETDNREPGSRFRKRGYALNPPFAQMIVGQSRLCTLSVLQEAFPEIEAGDPVQIECLTSELQVDRYVATLEPHPTQEGVLRSTWSIKALAKTIATGVRARVGPISAESVIEVLYSEAERFSELNCLEFQSKRYRVRTNTRKRIRLLAPSDIVRNEGGKFDLELKGTGYEYSGSTELRINRILDVAIADLRVSASRDDLEPGRLIARLGPHSAETEIMAALPEGTGITIKLEDVDHGAYRYRWKKNVLEIAARHRSLSRYLGPKSDQFPGQEERQFRVLLAEIVSDAVCSQVLRHNIETNAADYQDADWDQYYAEFSEYMAKFLPRAHELVVPDAK